MTEGRKLTSVKNRKLRTERDLLDTLELEWLVSNNRPSPRFYTTPNKQI